MNTLVTRSRIDKRGPWRRLFIRILANLQKGCVTVLDGEFSGTYGSGTPRVQLRVHAPRFYRRVLIGGSVGAGEAYVDGDWSTDDLVPLVRLMSINRSVIDRIDGGWMTVARALDKFSHRLRKNTRFGSRRNIGAHYDLSNEFFALFLDERMMYSSAIFEPGQESLEVASRAKLERLCQKLELEAGDHLLEVGSGWGGLAIYAASNFGCRVTTITISRQQYEEARRRVNAANLGDRITVEFRDYRDVDGVFDKIVSVEMVEAVGDEYLRSYFQKLDALLKPGGLMVIQAITIQDSRYIEALHGVDFIKKHVFPGSFIPSVSRLVEAAASRTTIVLVNLEDFGLDYAKTLRNWRERFEQSRERILSTGFDEAFIRMWRFYLSYCEGGFLERAISDVQLTFVKSGYRGQPWRVQSASPIRPGTNENC